MTCDLLHRLFKIVIHLVDALSLLILRRTGHNAFLYGDIADVKTMIRIVGDHLGNNILCSLQCFLRSLYFFFFGYILCCLVKHRFCCLLAQNIFCQRFQTLLLCNTGTGLSLGTIGAVQILYHYQRLSCQNLLL